MDKDIILLKIINYLDKKHILILSSLNSTLRYKIKKLPLKITIKYNIDFDMDLDIIHKYFPNWKLKILTYFDAALYFMNFNILTDVYGHFIYEINAEMYDNLDNPHNDPSWDEELDIEFSNYIENLKLQFKNIKIKSVFFY